MQDFFPPLCQDREKNQENQEHLMSMRPADLYIWKTTVHHTQDNSAIDFYARHCQCHKVKIMGQASQSHTVLECNSSWTKVNL